MRIVTVKMPEHYLEKIDKLVEEGLYLSRSDFIRIAVREWLGRELKRLEKMNSSNSIKRGTAAVL
jgi:Predicted transcriptional regulators containing the CopG/Arc/MetJ DNA-binding domain